MKLSHDRFFQVIASLKAADGVEVDQRHQPRVGLRASVIVAPVESDNQVGGAFAVRLQDLSSEGVSFQHIAAMRKGSQFVLDVPDLTPGAGDEAEAEATVRILCRVVHAHAAGGHKFVVGAQFVRLWTAAAPTLDAARAAA